MSHIGTIIVIILVCISKQGHILSKLHHLPDLLRLHQMLLDKYHRRIDAAEAATISIQDFLAEVSEGNFVYDCFAKGFFPSSEWISTYV